MKPIDKEIEKALNEFSQALGTDKQSQHFSKLWEKARYEGKPQYVDGVVMSGHIFEKSITEMRKMEHNASMFFKAIQQNKGNTQELLNDFNKSAGVNFKDEKQILKLFEQVHQVRVATQSLSQTMDGLEHRPQVIQSQFEPKILTKEEVNTNKIPAGMDLIKQDTLKKYQFMPPSEVRGGRIIVHLSASDLKDSHHKDNRPVELVMSNKQFVSMINCAMKKEEKNPVIVKDMTKEYLATMSKIYPTSTEQEHQQRFQTVKDSMSKGIKSMVQDTSFTKQQSRTKDNGMER